MVPHQRKEVVVAVAGVAVVAEMPLRPILPPPLPNNLPLKVVVVAEGVDRLAFRSLPLVEEAVEAEVGEVDEVALHRRVQSSNQAPIWSGSRSGRRR